MLTKNQIIEKFQLEPLKPEGGYFKRIYASADARADGRRFCASIYYMLESPELSCFHRIDCDELWHFYAGEPLLIYQIAEQGQLTQFRLGNPLTHDNVTPFVHIKRGVWFGSEVSSVGGMSLVGCTTIPEFQFQTFEAATQSALSNQFPAHADLIARLTRR